MSGGTNYYDASELKDADAFRRSLINGRRFRVAVIDNVKASCLNSPLIDSLVTAKELTGHKLYVGACSTPNYLVFALTGNGLALSRDLAQRTIRILLNEPDRSGGWDDKIDDFLAKHQEKVIADIAAFFDRPKKAMAKHTRWQSWESDVLSRCDSPEVLQNWIASGQQAMDSDRSSADGVADYFAEQIRLLGYSPETQTIHIPNWLAARWLTECSGSNQTLRSANAHIKQLVAGGSLKKLVENPSRRWGRGWLWNAGASEVLYPEIDSRSQNEI